MKMNFSNVVALFVLLAGGAIGHAQNQYSYPYPPKQATPVQQYYTPSQQQGIQSQQQYQNRLSFTARRAYPNPPDSRSYDPLAGEHEGQNRPGGFWAGAKSKINPCQMNYGVVLDGWHDMGLLMTVKSWEWWLAVIFFAALAVVGFDDLFRSWRAKDVREAMAGAALLFMNDRAQAIEKCNDAILRHNLLLQQHDVATQERDVQSHIEMADAMRRVAIQAAEGGGSSDGSASSSTISTATPVALSSFDLPITVPENTSSQPKQNATENHSSVNSSASSTEADGDSPDMVTLNLGGTKYKVARPVMLHVNSLNRKIENLRTQNNKLEERLKQYEKE